MARLIVDAPEEPKLTLELTVDEAAVLMILTGETAGGCAVVFGLYDALYDESFVRRRAEQFKFTAGEGGQAMRVDPR